MMYLKTPPKIVYFLRGLPASGKSTWTLKKMEAIESVYGKGSVVRANKDTIRLDMYPDGYEHKNERFVVIAERELVDSAMAAHQTVIIDNTHFSEFHEKTYRELASVHGYQFEIVDFTHVSLEECIRRDALRENPVGETVIRGMWEKYLQPVTA